MNNLTLYRTWIKALEQQVPRACASQRVNMAWLIVGLYLGRSVYASAIVKVWPIKAFVSSLTRRLSRFLDNPRVQVREWYAATAQVVLARGAGGSLTLILDGSRVGFGHQLLMVAAAYRRRALPVVWCWHRGVRGHSSARVQLALLDSVRQRLPPQTQVLVLGDAEFGSMDVIRTLRCWGWSYVLRQKSHQWFRPWRTRFPLRFGEVVSTPGQRAWYPNARLTEQRRQRTSVLAWWAPGEAQPWLLATNLPSLAQAIRAYAKRMWIEELFGDLKDHGFDLEATHLRHFLRLSRLTLAVCLLYVWLILLGARVIRNGQRLAVDRRDRRDLSLFRIGLDWLMRRLVLDPPVRPAHLILQVSGG